VFLYDVDDLQAVAAHGAAQRRAEIPKAEDIVEQEVATFWTWHDALAVVPVIKELRGRLEALRAAELERALKHLGHLAPEDRAQLEHFSHSLLNKFLHEPTRALKAAAENGRGYALLEAVRRLFGFGTDA
jgi:glutamyl-tRNA reductase